MPRRHLTEAEKEQIKELAAAGYLPVQVARKMGRSCATICRAFDDEKLPRKRLKKRHRLTESDVRLCVKLYSEEGLTLEQISERFGIYATTVRDRLIKAGYSDFNSPGAPPKFTDKADKQTIIEHYESGFSSNFLSTKFRCSADAINKVLDDAGIKRRTHLESVGFRWTDSRNREHLMRSSWEVCTAQWLDDRGDIWDYELKSFVLDDNGKRRRYTPDFWVYGPGGSIVKIIEVKGWTSESCEHRMNLFRESNPELPFEVWEETELKQKGILDVVIRVQPKRVAFAGSPTRMSNRERLRAMNLFDEGLSYKSIAVELQRGASTISSFLKSTGRVTTKSLSNRGRVSKEKRDQAAALYLAGDSITTTAKKTGLSRDVVYGEVKRRGISRSLSNAQKVSNVGGIRGRRKARTEA